MLQKQDKVLLPPKKQLARAVITTVCAQNTCDVHSTIDALTLEHTPNELPFPSGGDASQHDVPPKYNDLPVFERLLYLHPLKSFLTQDTQHISLNCVS